MMLTEEQIQIAVKAWPTLFRAVTDYMNQMIEVMRKWWPVFSGIQREEARRVHSLYRRKQLARRKRNRRR